MTKEKYKDFENIINLIDARNYVDAATELKAIYVQKDEEKSAYADYLLGYINTRWDNSQKNPNEAYDKLYSNINSKYPHPLAFVLYADVQDDKNIAENYLRKGIKLFPKETKIYEKLLHISTNKDNIIHKITEQGFYDISLLGNAISYLFSNQEWNKISLFIFRMENNNELTSFEKRYLKLISAYILLFDKNPDFEKVKIIFENIITQDTDNRFSYSHYLGIIYAYMQLGNYQKCIEFFDKLPVTNSICDFDDGPWPLEINLNFEKQYKIIFEALLAMFSKDRKRKNKTAALYSLYLYSPSSMSDICRYKRTDITALSRYLKTEFNAEAAAALYNMRCHFKQFKEAYEILWSLLTEEKNPKDKYVYLSEITDNITKEEFLYIANKTVEHLQNDDYDEDVFLSQIFPELIENLHKNQQYENIQTIADFFTVEQILQSKQSFECAYAYGTTNNDRSKEIYQKIIKNEPTNSAAINNLGVQYEHRKDLYKAFECYKNALTITPEDEIQQNNLKRIQKQITIQINEEISFINESISLESLDEIGYTTDLCKKILSIQDDDMKSIILRDLRECAIAVIARQDKTATIMCGSIIEALLMERLREKGIMKYDISEISKSKHALNYTLTEMGLNELLFIAEKESLLDRNNWHLGHYIRDYRNVVHPAKEIRMKEEISHSNVLTMWSVLTRLIEEIL